MFKAATAPIMITPLNEVEFANALELRCFRKEMASNQASRVWNGFEADLAAGAYSTIPMPAEVFPAAVRLVRRHSAKLGSKSLDVLHVVSALSAGAGAFYSFDTVQNRLAALEGLQIL
jgi:hypothetical protein